MSDPTGPPAVAVCVVTHESAADVAPCLAAVAALEHRPLELVVVDCASADGTPAAVERAAPAVESAGVAVTCEPLAENLGFAGGMNRALGRTAAPWVLSLNADARPEPDYVGRLLACVERHPDLRVGAVTGRLLRLPAAAGVDGASGRRDADATSRLDACGMLLTRSWRHLDRGSGEPDRGQWGVADRVFGATGAASLFRRAALDDVAVEGELFAESFHSFREDAELAFRLRERGWEVLYEPRARALHRRAVVPERRRRLPAEINRRSLQNRYLLRAYHQTWGNFWKTLPAATARDLAALAWVVAVERTSLGAYGWLWRHRREIFDRRRLIQGRRTAPAAAIDRWFGRSGEAL